MSFFRFQHCWKRCTFCSYDFAYIKHLIFKRHLKFLEQEMLVKYNLVIKTFFSPPFFFFSFFFNPVLNFCWICGFSKSLLVLEGRGNCVMKKFELQYGKLVAIPEPCNCLLIFLIRGNHWKPSHWYIKSLII